MGQMRRLLCTCCAVVVASGLWTGCSSKSPADKVAEIRLLYSARMNGFIIEEEPIIAEEPMIEDVVDGGGEVVEEDLVVEPVQTRQNVRLDLLIQHDSYDLLPGVTVDISMADGSGEEKGH